VVNATTAEACLGDVETLAFAAEQVLRGTRTPL
jgi:hypothetical protein